MKLEMWQSHGRNHGNIMNNEILKLCKFHVRTNWYLVFVKFVFDNSLL